MDTKDTIKTPAAILAAALMLGSFAIVGCEKAEEPTTVEGAMEKAGEAADDAADAAKDAAEDAGEAIEDAADEATDAVEDATGGS